MIVAMTIVAVLMTVVSGLLGYSLSRKQEEFLDMKRRLIKALEDTGKANDKLLKREITLTNMVAKYVKLEDKAYIRDGSRFVKLKK